MFCQRWSPRTLLPKVDLISFLLMQNPHVTGVALTGSLARFEPLVHDIDLVVFHDGMISDLSCSEPRQDVEKDDYSSALPLACVIENGVVARHITQARNGVPINFIFVNERVLSDCDYLQSLVYQEWFPGFYQRVFCGLPLYLLGPYHRRGILVQSVTTEEIVALERCPNGSTEDKFSYPAVLVRHVCDNPLCKPTQAWEECREEIRLRKNHWWHD